MKHNYRWLKKVCLIVFVIFAATDMMAQSNAQKRSAQARAELQRLLNLQRQLDKLPIDGLDKEPQKSFLIANEKDIVYNEPGGNYYVRSARFWDLETKYRGLMIADRIAWEAANNPLPGECEGFVNCYIYAIRTTTGKYLEKYPRGEYAAKAMNSIAKFLEALAEDKKSGGGYEWPNDRTDKAELGKILDDLRGIVTKTSNSSTRPLLLKIRKIKLLAR
ncbi:hypothetical protein [Leptolyngbya sp. 7M]|uniref:hypothetical protein n=1 Tax=Leptolyngbya sp. 7M TaxID=2812896 RepID=UPI001B8BCD4E|nr:hypothetical protein [Leptolyngbya sp. 7M]QYO67241.1 hypothetical protein JVX88_10800 [Leptolyngbya sp. 7M]